MSGRKRGHTVFNRLGRSGRYGCFFLAGLAVFGLCGCSTVPCAEVRGDRAARIRGYQDEAARLRGLPPKGAVSVEQETPAALLVSLEKELDKPENRAFLADTELLLQRFRVLKPELSLRSAYLKLMSQQVAAYYDPEKKRLAYVDENVSAAGKQGGPDLPGMERFVYVHEFCHALEDAHYDLDRLTKASLCELDRNLALTSFAEGNAVLTGIDGLIGGYGLAMNTATPFGAWCVNLFDDADMDSAAEEMKGLPPFLTGALLRPYLDGAVFSNRIRRDAGWQAVDEIYRSRLPLTTAEILYPERRYLKGFKAASFEPAEGLLREARQGVCTNSLGALGIALWLGGDEPAAAHEYGFLKGWMGDRVYLFAGDDGDPRTVWLSLWERPGMARAFCRKVGRRLRQDFADVPHEVRREGRLVAVVWGGSAQQGEAACSALADLALQTRVEADLPPAWASWSNDLPWPLRFPSFPGHASGCELLGGYAADLHTGDAFFRFSLASGLLLRTEANPDRHYYGVLGGLVRHVEDRRSDFTFWKIPFLASWHRNGRDEREKYRWTVACGLLADGTETRARVLFVPVWRAP